MSRRKWTEEEIILLEEMYKNGSSIKEMSENINRTTSSIGAKICELKLDSKYTRKNSVNFKAIYQDYNWCYENYIVKGKTFEEMANMCNSSKRVIQKWCCEKYKLNRKTRKYLKKLTKEQKDIIIIGTLGDGHIDKRENQHMYIESHSEEEKEYLFWKYEKLKNLCNNKPKYYKSKTKYFGDNEYICKPYYRFETHLLDCLNEILDMSILEKISLINEKMLMIYLLDDGSRSSSNWSLCVANMNDLESKEFVDKCKELGYVCTINNNDKRYITFKADSSRKLDQKMIEMFGDIDIIRKKITEKKLTKDANYMYVKTKDKEIGISTYTKKYEKLKDYMEENNINTISEKKALEVLYE